MNKNILIIGGTRGIGLSISIKFLQEKNIVHIISRNKILNIEEDLRKKFTGKVFFYNCDATQVDELSSVRKDILKNSDNIIG